MQQSSPFVCLFCCSFSSNCTLQDISDLQTKGLSALRSPSLMNEGLHRSLQAADAAINPSTVAMTPTTATSAEAPNQSANMVDAAAMHEASGMPTVSALASLNPALGVQLSHALYHSFMGPPVAATASTTANTNHAHTMVAAANNANATAALGGIGIAVSAAAGAKSIMTGSAGTPCLTDMKSLAANSYHTVMEIDGGPTVLQASEMHYTDTLKKNAGFLPNKLVNFEMLCTFG